MTGRKVENKPDFELIKDTPYLTLTGELWGVYYEDFDKKWYYNIGTSLC